MNDFKSRLPWIIRFIISFLFLFSAFAKMYPTSVWPFEKQLVDLDLFSWCTAPYFARAIIALEIAIGFAILQNHFIKRLVIPLTVLLLFAFNIHLAIEGGKHGFFNGNCGCFGQLVKMTPFEAFIKNLLTIGLLIYLYLKVNDKEKGENKMINLVAIYLGSALLMFTVFPFAPCEDEVASDPIVQTPIVESDTTSVAQTNNELPVTATPSKTDTVKKDSKVVKEKPVVELGPKKVQSKFTKYTTFGNTVMNVNEGKKLICMFVPGCDHCRDAAREIGQMAKKPGFPEVCILFMDEEVELIPEFSKVTGTNFPYQVIGVVEFWKLLGNDANTPGVIYLWNGNIIKQYEGTEGNKFVADDLKKRVFN